MTDGTAQYRPSAGRLTAMAGLTVLAIVSFVVLLDVRLNQGDWWFEGLSDAASRSTMSAILVILELASLVGIALLLFIHPRTNPWEPTSDWTTEMAESSAAASSPAIQIGCPGCGTVFEKPYTDVDEPHEQSFRCPNCGRAGRLRMGLHKKVPMHSLTCRTCGRGFIAYRETAECPHCHAPQA